MKHRPISFTTLTVFLYLCGLIPLLVIIGMTVYGLHRNTLLENTRDRLIESVTAEVNALDTLQPSLSRLAVALGNRLRLLGADSFVQDAAGSPVPPALGTGPWMSAEEHQSARTNGEGTMTTIKTSTGDRLVYLAPILDSQGMVIGSVEASLNLNSIDTEMKTLQRTFTIIFGVGVALATLLALLFSQTAIRPLRGLVQTASRVSAGDLSCRADEPPVVEIAHLARTMNSMLESIQTALDTQRTLTEEMRRFVTDASHELRSPLAVFRTSVEILDKAVERGDWAEIPEVTGILRGEVDAMTALVEDLLFLARMDRPAGEGGELKFSLVEPFPLLEEVFERAQMVASGQNLELAWSQTGLEPIRMDRDLVRRALNNLVENAIHHTAPGKRIILAAVRGQGWTDLVVQDEGVGIPPEDMDHIFERFYRADLARNRKSPSTGLGLAIVQTVMTAHDGKVLVESIPGVGTTMRLRFLDAPNVWEIQAG